RHTRTPDRAVFRASASPAPPGCNAAFAAGELFAIPSAAPVSDSLLLREITRRKTFAIISHPDAGKTTLTEKLLLYGGAIQLAGAVKAKRARAHAVSNWMEMERERGISIASSVLQFPYKGRLLSLVDT